MRLARVAIAINRAHSMKDEVGGQLSRARGDRASRAAAADAGTNSVELAHNGGAASRMNRPIDAAPAHQFGIGGIDDGVHFDFGDITAQELKLHQADLNGEIRGHDGWGRFAMPFCKGLERRRHGLQQKVHIGVGRERAHGTYA